MASGVAGWPQAMPRQIWNMPGPLMWPVSIMRLASRRWPVSNTSSSGITSASRMAVAMVCRWAGVLMNTIGPILSSPCRGCRCRAVAPVRGARAPPGRLNMVPGPGLRGVVVARHEARARAGGQVDQDVQCRSRGCARPLRDKARRPCWAWWSVGRARGCGRSRRPPWRRRCRIARSAAASPARPGSCPGNRPNR